jgi:carbonic anhydrase
MSESTKIVMIEKHRDKTAGGMQWLSRADRFWRAWFHARFAPSPRRPRKAPWSYEDAKEWGEHEPAYRACAIGGEQSPVDLKGTIKADIHAPILSWKPQAFKIVNNGHTIQANAAPGSFATSENREFELKQFHFHTPSEHAVQGKCAQMEAHFVHADDGGELLVLGVLLEPGSKNIKNKGFRHSHGSGSGDGRRSRTQSAG